MVKNNIEAITKLAKSLEESGLDVGLVIEVSFYETGSTRVGISKEEFLQSFEIYDVHDYGLPVGISLFAIFQGATFATSLNPSELEEVKDYFPRHYKFINNQVKKISTVGEDDASW